MGAISGGLSAGFPGAGALIDVALSVAETVNDGTIAGKSAQQIVGEATLNAMTTAVFSSMDSFFTNKSTYTAIGKAFKSLKSTFRGNHPNIRSTAKRIWTSTWKRVGKNLAKGVVKYGAYAGVTYAKKKLTDRLLPG